MARPSNATIIENQVKDFINGCSRPDILPEVELDENGNIQYLKDKNGNFLVINGQKVPKLKTNDVYNSVFDGVDTSNNAIYMKAVFCEDKDDVYRLLRYGIQKLKIYNSHILFVREAIFNAYIFPEYEQKESYKYVGELLKVISGNIPKNLRDKWIVCDSLEQDFNFELATHFIAQLSVNNVKGIIFSHSSSSPNSFYKCLKQTEVCTIIEI